MGYTEVFLYSSSLFCLREIGKKIGVKSPTSLTKKQLVKEILSVQNGEKPPFFSNRGRKKLLSSLYDKNFQENFSCDDLKKIIDSEFEQIIDLFLVKLKDKIMKIYNSN